MTPDQARRDLLLAAGVTPERAVELATKAIAKFEQLLEARDFRGEADNEAQARAAKEIANLVGLSPSSSTGGGGSAKLEVVLVTPEYARTKVLDVTPG